MKGASKHIKKTKRTGYFYIAFSLLLFLASHPVLGVAMSLFSGKEEDVVLFSPLEGTLTFQGKPAAGAKITRKVSWKDDVGETDVFYADDKGHFSLPLKSAHLKLSGLSQFVGNQNLTVGFNNQEYPIWRMSKLDKGLYGELDGRPTNVRCELTDEMVRVSVLIGILVTACKWDDIIENGAQ